MPGAEVDDAATAKAAADATGNFPGFEQLFPRQAAGAAHDPCDPMEMRVVREATEIVVGETGFRRWGEHASVRAADGTTSSGPFHESGLPTVGTRRGRQRGRLIAQFPRKACGRGLRMACLPPAFTQGVLVFVAQSPSGPEPCRKDDAWVGFSRRCRILPWRGETTARETGQRGECLVDRIQLIEELVPFRLQQTHRVVQINHGFVLSFRSRLR
jgi:hypothetical protein